MNFSQCPRCQKHIPDHRRIRGLSVCECGWIGSVHEQRAESSSFNRSTFSLLLLSIVMVAAFIYIAKWDTEGGNVLKIQILELVDYANSENYKEYERICMARKLYDCTERAIQRQIELGSKDREIQARLGKMYFAKKEKLKAYKAFTAYFNARGRDVEAAYMFSVLLSDMSRLDQAISYLQFVLENDKEQKYHLQATRSYVMILVTKQNLQEAREIIYRIRSEDQKANMFMEDTLRFINDQLSKKAEKAAPAKTVSTKPVSTKTSSAKTPQSKKKS